MQRQRVRTPRRELAASPVHRAVWDRDVPVELFDSAEPEVSPAARAVMDASVVAVRRFATEGHLYGEDGFVSGEVVAELARIGYWGLRVPLTYGGLGASFPAYAQSLTQVATADPWVSVLGSVQAALGPVTTLNLFADETQRRRLLPPLARGDRLGAFAMTEPQTSSDLGAMRTEATRVGDELLLTGEKLLITNAVPGNTATVLCRVDGDLRVLMVELPDVEDDRFRTVPHPVRAFRHVPNRGLLFDRLPVPAGNLLAGHGRAIAYGTLNYGRVAVCAGSGGLLTRATASLVPWVQHRTSFGAPIGSRELVRLRLGRLAARIVGCEAVAVWAAQLLAHGYRGELEGVLAKVFGSEMLKEAAVDLVLKTHGGRALLAGNAFADDAFDFLAPTVYEGENEIVTLGFFRALARPHAEDVLAPLNQALRTASSSPGRVWRATRPAVSYAGWLARRHLEPAPRRPVPVDLDGQTQCALRLLRRSGLDVDAALRRYGTALADRQALMLEVAQRVQAATAMLVVSRYGLRQADPLRRQAAACLAAELGHRLTGQRPTPAYHRLVTELGGEVAGGRFAALQGVAVSTPALLTHLPPA